MEGVVGVAVSILLCTADWPSFRGPSASGIAEGINLPDTWNGATGANILWKTAIPGLAHSSPIVSGDRIFLTAAVSSRGNATFKPGLYGEGTASEVHGNTVIVQCDQQKNSFLLA